MCENLPFFFDGFVDDLWLCSVIFSIWTPAGVIDLGSAFCAPERNAIDDSAGTAVR